MLKLRKLKSLKVEIIDQPGQKHHFPTKFVTKALIEGWISLDRGKLTIHAENGELVYNLVRYPGAYCDNCGDRLGDGPALTAAEADVRREHAQGHSNYKPNPKNPAGYSVINHYDALLVKRKK